MRKKGAEKRLSMEEAKNGKKTAPTDGEEKKQNLKQIIIFLLITFILTYGVEIFMIMPMRGSTDINEAYAAQSLIAGVMFVPALSALFTRMITKERLGPNNLMITINLKGNLKYYGLVWPGFALLILLGTVLYFLLFPAHFDPELGYLNAVMEAQAQMQESAPAITPENVKRTLIMQILMAAVISPFVNLINCFGEEWGWRGFLLPKMMKQMKIVPALLVNGVIWGLWHVPLTIMGHNYGMGYRGYPVTGILAMCVFCTVMGIILSYVTIKTRSCIPAVLGHGMLNGFSAVGIYFTSLENPYNIFLGPTSVGLIGGLGFIFLAAYLLYLLYKEEKQKSLLQFDGQGATIQKN